MTINTVNSGEYIILELDGRIDTTTSTQLQNEILNTMKSGKKLILDFAKVPYISSAGLRALLIGQKTANSKGLTMELVNVCQMVMSVLDSVGFSKILTIS